MSAAKTILQSIYSVKAKYHFWKFVQDPTDTIGIIHMTEAFQKAATEEMINQMLGPLLENPLLRDAYEEKYWPRIPNQKELNNFPKESFGYQASQFFQKWNLNPDLFPEPDFSSPQSYITSRIYQAHDFWHVLTGYDISLEGELALQAFGVGQYKQPISLVIIAGGLMHLLQKTPERAPIILQRITEGFDRGIKARNLLTESVLERLTDPLIKVQGDLGLGTRGTNERQPNTDPSQVLHPPHLG